MARETWVQSKVESYQRLKKMVLDASLLNTQHYKVRIKGKVEQSREGVAPSPTPWCSSHRKGSLLVILDYGRQLYFTYIDISLIFSAVHVKSIYLSIYLSITLFLKFIHIYISLIVYTAHIKSIYLSIYLSINSHLY